MEMDLLPKAMRVLHDELPNIEVKLTSDYSPEGLRRFDEGQARRRVHATGNRTPAVCKLYKRVRTEPLILVFPRGHRLAARKAIQLREIKGEPFIKPSKTAPTLRKIIEDTLKRSGLDTHANHEVHR